MAFVNERKTQFSAGKSSFNLKNQAKNLKTPRGYKQRHTFSKSMICRALKASGRSL